MSRKLPVFDDLGFIKSSLVTKSAEDISVLDISVSGDAGSYYVFATALSARHAKTLADHLIFVMRERGFRKSGVCGYENGDWIVVDFISVTVHLFRRPVRAYYDVESLWKERGCNIVDAV